MLEQGHPFSLATIVHLRDDYPLLRKHIYRFTNSRDTKYLAPIHEYDYNVFALKFHLRQHKNHPNRYNLIVNENDFGRTLRTILDIAIDILGKQPSASFAFVGVHKIGNVEQKDTENNQRFRVYKQITENFFGEDTFLHGYSTKTNTYLLINKKNNNPIGIYELVVQMFAKHFQDLGDL